MRHYLILLFIWLSINSMAQSVNVQYVFAGQITNYETGKKEGSVTATLISGVKVISTVMTATNGKYLLTATMPAQSNFQIVFSKPGFVSKRIACNFSSMNTERMKEGEKITPIQDLSLEIFSIMPGVDFTFLEKEPVATFGLNAENIVPTLDIAASQRIKQKIEGLLANPTPQPNNAEANYNAAIKSGDNLFGQKKYNEALKQYENAAGIKPKEFYPQKKIAEIDALLKAKKNEVAAESETDKQYNNLIKAADNFRDNKQYPEAIAKYNTALRVKNEQYPKDQIKNIESLVAEARKEEREDRSYQDAIDAADVAINAKNYKVAQERYEAALVLKSDEQYPKDQLVIVRSELKKIADELNKQKKYEETIAAADQLFGGSKFIEAKAKYTEALAIIASETYPKDKIKSCDELIAKNAKAIKDAEEIKRLFEEGQKLIDNKSYTNAQGKYKQILQIDPKTNLAQAKLDEINRLIKADADAKNTENNIKGFISEGDAAVKNEQYDLAKQKYGAALEVKEDVALREKYNALLSKIAAAQAKKLLDQKFEESMKAANALMETEKLVEARIAYQAAANIDASRTEPKMRMAEIDAKLIKTAEADKAYRAIMDKGDALMQEEKYLAAIEEFYKALLLRPTDKEPKDKADQAERLERARGDVANEQFEKIISVSRTKIENQEFDKAIELLNRAITLRSPERKTDNRPEEMLDEIQKIKRIDASYNEKIIVAEAFAKEKQYDRAISKFGEAAALKSNEVLPVLRIEELKKVQSELLGAAQKENLFNEVFKKATNAKAAKDYDLALENFKQALNYKPDNQAVKDHIAEVEQILDERRLKEENSKNQREKMAALISDADRLFDLGDWGEAKIAYQGIVNLDKDQVHANARIKECDLRLSEEKNKTVNTEYKALIASADTNFEKKDFLRSKELFEKAKVLRPKDGYPIKKLEEIDLLLNPVIAVSTALEVLGDVYLGSNGEADLIQAESDRQNEKTNEFSAARDEANAQREKYNGDEIQLNYETKDAIGNVQIRGEQESALAKEQVQRKNDYLTQIKKYGNDLNEQNALYEKSDNYQAQEKIKYIEQNVSETSEIQGRAYKRNAQKVKDNAALITTLNENKGLANQDYQIQNGQELKKMSIEAQESLNDDESRLAMQEAIRAKKLNAEKLSQDFNYQESISTRQITSGLNDLRDKSENKTLLEEGRLALNNEQIKSVETKMHDEDRSAYNHEMENYLQTKQAINTQEKVGLRKSNGANEKTDANNLKIKSKRIRAEQNNVSLSASERTDNQNSQRNIDAIKITSSKINSESADQQFDNNEALRLRKESFIQASKELDEKADKKNLDSRENIESLIAVNAENDKKTIDKQLKNSKMVDEVISVASTQAQDNAKRTQENQREITSSIHQVDPAVKIEKIRNTLGGDYPEGVTEEKFSQNGSDGKLSKILTRRIVVIDGHGDVYVRTQMKGVSTYKKNEEAISEYTWQKETQSSSLVRH